MTGAVITSSTKTGWQISLRNHLRLSLLPNTSIPATSNHLPTAYAMTTTIPEAKAAKAALEQIIAHRLREFSAETGTTVTSVFIDPVIVLGAPASYRVEVEARL